jgi:hypothetical protein
MAGLTVHRVLALRILVNSPFRGRMVGKLETDPLPGHEAIEIFSNGRAYIFVHFCGRTGYLVVWSARLRISGQRLVGPRRDFLSSERVIDH